MVVRSIIDPNLIVNLMGIILKSYKTRITPNRKNKVYSEDTKQAVSNRNKALSNNLIKMTILNNSLFTVLNF